MYIVFSQFQIWIFILNIDFFQNKCLQGKSVQILLGKISAQVSQHLFSLSFMMQSNLSRNSTIIQNPLLIY